MSFDDFAAILDNFAAIFDDFEAIFDGFVAIFYMLELQVADLHFARYVCLVLSALVTCYQFKCTCYQ